MGNVYSSFKNPHEGNPKQSLLSRIFNYIIPHTEITHTRTCSSRSSSRTSSRTPSSISSPVMDTFTPREFKKQKRPFSSVFFNSNDNSKRRKISVKKKDDIQNLQIKLSANNININNDSLNFKFVDKSNLGNCNNKSSTDHWKKLQLLNEKRYNEIPALRKNIQSSSFNKEFHDYDDDLIILKERKIPVYEKLNNKYRDRLVFDSSYFESLYQQFLISSERQKEARIKYLEELQNPKKSLIPELTDEERREIIHMFKKNSSSNPRISNRFKLSIYLRDLQTLAPTKWLNSSVIEYFLKVIEDENPKIVSFSPFFITKLSESGYTAVKRWMKMKKKNINDVHKILVPINVNRNHWVCSMIDLQKNKIFYLDSLCSTKNSPIAFRFMQRLKDYVIQESGGSLGKDLEMIHLESPQQSNGYDCGIFTLMNLLQLANDEAIVMNQTNANDFRFHIANEILKQRIDI
ncbi:hypothetical protein ACO0R3_000340 [Hanseniaspora guilliermondii]